MRLKPLETLGAVFFVVGLSITPDHGNAGANLLATIVLLSLGAACFAVSKRNKKTF